MSLYDFDRYNEPDNDDLPWWGKVLASAIGVGLLLGLVALLKWLEK